MTREDFLHYFKYDRKEGTLTWVNPPKSKSYLLNREAGTVRQDKRNFYRLVCVNRKIMTVHKIIWFLETGKWEKLIDHIDGDGLNNKFSNLKPCSNRKNQHNRYTHRSGRLVGASWDTERRRWFSCIQIEGKTKFLGRFSTEQLAHDRYMKELKSRGL